MNTTQQKYKKTVAADDMPRDPKPPTLKLCQLHEGRLQIPMDIRQLFMQCPIHGPEWREMVTKFDTDWGSTPAPANQSPPPSTPPPTQSSGGEPSPAQVKVETKLEEDFEWSSVFRDSPTTLADLKRKFGDELTEMAGVGTVNSFYLAPGPQLYVVAKDPIHVKCTESPIISHGAGSWLTGDKATKFETNSPDRGIPCEMTSDLISCVYEELDPHQKQDIFTLHTLMA